MAEGDYYSERKWCRRCGRNVRYLMSVHHSYCFYCGGVVTLFSKDQWRRFNRQLTAIKAMNKARRKAVAF